MKIKMRTDDVSTPNRNEWAEMNDWLAELKDESQADEGRDSQASLTGAGDAEPASGPGPADAVRAVHDRPRASNAGPVSDTRTVSDPRAASYPRPAQDPRAATNPRPAQDPRAATNPRPIQDPRAATNPRPIQDPRAATNPRPIQDPRAATNPRPIQDPRAATNPRPAQDPRAATNPRPVQDPRPATRPPPTHGPTGREARTAGANGRIPAAPPMRPLIGDELRMPIMWCEMGYCISWHADPSALGEADNRARAIQAGWRIDALGRMTCPQCQQTTVAFRATRPVVLWDRATAMAMAARAAAPGYRTMGTAGRARDRRPRPAFGHQ